MSSDFAREKILADDQAVPQLMLLVAAADPAVAFTAAKIVAVLVGYGKFGGSDIDLVDGSGGGGGSSSGGGDGDDGVCLNFIGQAMVLLSNNSTLQFPDISDG